MNFRLLMVIVPLALVAACFLDGLGPAMSYAPLADSPIQRADIYIANRDGTNRQPYLEHRGTFESYDHPAWSPDENWIYFTRNDVFIDDGQIVAFSASGELAIGAEPVDSFWARFSAFKLPMLTDFRGLTT